ncbi:hypothetical protein [Paenibacillus sp. FSL P4-0288]|uniref:hypothetical protein n=1 Tax=Paenibacillus sp. FSL P4-0288 TaxID=2921633 RepID=UPI0030FAE340
MEVKMQVSHDGNGNFNIYLVYKIFEDSSVPIRNLLDIKESLKEAEDFANRFIKTLSISEIEYYNHDGFSGV